MLAVWMDQPILMLSLSDNDFSSRPFVSYPEAHDSFIWENAVCVPFKTKHHQSFSKRNQVGVFEPNRNVPNLNQSNLDLKGRLNASPTDAKGPVVCQGPAVARQI